jgi:hypothetical protein
MTCRLLNEDICSRLLKKGPACAEASAGRQMRVEPCEIPRSAGQMAIFQQPDRGGRA